MAAGLMKATMNAVLVLKMTRGSLKRFAQNQLQYQNFKNWKQLTPHTPPLKQKTNKHEY